MYNVFYIPLDISLEISSHLPSYFYYIDYIVDLMFFMDIIFTFRTVLVKEHGYFSKMNVKQKYVVYNKREIAENYMKGTFFIDLVASLPLELVAILFCKLLFGEVI